jgi:hypothetical protein
MGQSSRVQIFDQTSTSGGNITFPASSGYPIDGLSALVISIQVTVAATGAVTLNALRDDGSAVLIKTSASITSGTTDWSFSLSDFQQPGTSSPTALLKKIQLLLVGATTSVARVTIWAIKLES